ncbi:MAG: DUF2207 domain-containing protein, partial [Bacteroidota bacterium]
EVYLEGDVKYTIDYRVSGAIVSYDTHDEFYWNVIPFNSDVPIDLASFSIRFPSAWADSLAEYVAFAGRYGSRDEELVVSNRGTRYSAATTRRLNPGEGMTFAVRLHKGLAKASYLTSASSSTNSKVHPAWMRWLVLLPLGIGALILSIWNRLNPRRVKPDPIVTFYPPTGFSPAEVGTFYDHRVHQRDIISLLPYWGELGYIKIQPLSGSEHDMTFIKQKNLPDGSPSYQTHFFEELFKHSDVVLLSDLRHKFHQTMTSTSYKVYREVLSRPLYDESYRSVFHSWRTILAGLFCTMAGALLCAFGVILAGIGMILIGLILFILRAMEPRLSTHGQEMKHHLQGLRMWLADPDPEELTILLKKDPNYLYRMFPFAVAFGLDQSWQKRLGEFETLEPPIWLDTSAMALPTNAFTMGHLASAFQPRVISKVFTSTPPSSGGSGGSFSGGGFSGSAGGGMGGGSVGSW